MPQALDIRQKSELRRNPGARFSAAIKTVPGATRFVVKGVPEGSAEYVFIDTVLTRLPGGDLLALGEDDRISDIEFIDDALIRNVVLLLGRLEQLHRYIRTGMHDAAVLNLSLAPPRQLINRKPSRTGEATVRRAIETFTLGLDLPVVMAIGNDGPDPGTMNPWAKASGVITVSAADQAGTRLWDQASRTSANDDLFVVSAWGIDTVTARDTRYESDLPIEPEIVRMFSAERAKSLRFVTGTSFAAPQVGKVLCGLHQMMVALRMTLSSTVTDQFVNPPYIRALVDSAIDREAPQFHLRQVEKAKKYAGLSVTLPEGHKQELHDAVQRSAADLDLRLTPATAQRYLRQIARPLTEAPEAPPFVAVESLGARLAELRLSDLLPIFADPQDPRIPDWRAALAATGDPLVLPSDLARQIEAYCENYDLVLALPLAVSE
ncbi:MAG: S8/S53 family peptidase [Pseudomonadota bacterium]